VEAIYEEGVLRPVQPLEGIAEHCRVRVTVEIDEAAAHPLADCVGILPDEDADEMLRIVQDAFERVDPDEWQ
jgi:predicted DNA-binding antitoxin AbrB/MazE fold protein